MLGGMTSGFLFFHSGYRSLLVNSLRALLGFQAPSSVMLPQIKTYSPRLVMTLAEKSMAIGLLIR